MKTQNGRESSVVIPKLKSYFQSTYQVFQISRPRKSVLVCALDSSIELILFESIPSLTSEYAGITTERQKFVSRQERTCGLIGGFEMLEPSNVGIDVLSKSGIAERRAGSIQAVLNRANDSYGIGLPNFRNFTTKQLLRG